MSKSVDETVFDFFCILLQEPTETVPDAEEFETDKKALSAIENDNESLIKQSTFAEDVVKEVNVEKNNKNALSSEIQPSSHIKKEQVNSSMFQSPAPARVNRPDTAQKHFAQSSVDKDALSKLLSAVSKPNLAKKSVVDVQQSIKNKAEELRRKIEGDGSVVPLAAEVQLSETENKDLKKSADRVINKAVNVDSEQEPQQLKSADIALSSVPPSITNNIQEVLDDEFQVLFFNVAGLTLAVPLVSLGGIVKIEHINHLIGRPKWFLGVQTRREQTVNVVDSCQWVMPEKYTKELADSIDYQYIVMLEDSDWGFACESLVNSVKINKSHVNWREKAGKRPWLAGVVKEQMCGILNVQALIEMLDAGLGCQDSID
ncbi:chemotaxis protein CheW [Shewanella donghaensis]|uniref:chemotaxis protein CheW n=1 Tax=Shewanella donghaensis TaxID=238836 RepID=UPI0011837E73|nr:chemotaxis protein CheW [Shewanella donghaensis]